MKNLKSKTGLKGLWSGGKFKNIVEDDKTPDISISSSDDDDGGEINVDFKKIHLDSDEDEMRIDYLREKSVDVNNNNVDDVDDDDGDLNLMENIHFAELNFNDIDLTDEEDLKKKKKNQSKDFLPNLFTVDSNDSNNNNNSDVSDYQVGNNIKFLSSIESEIGAHSIKEQEHSSIHSIHGSFITNEIKSESIHSEYSHKNIKYSTDYSQAEFESEEVSNKSKSLMKKDKHQKKKRSTSSTSTNSTATSKESSSRTKKSSRGSSSRKTRENKHDSYSDTTLSSTTSDIFSTSRQTSTDKSTVSGRKTRSSKHTRTKETTSKKSYTKDSSPRRSQGRKKKVAETQTDDTYNVLNFKYPWQFDRPHNIAAATVGPESLDVLTSYSPAVLAAHDMVKYHFQLLQQHIENSRRLYESYASESNGKLSNFHYTTVEDTMRFIKENRPKVTTFEEALKKVQEEEKEC